MNKNDIFQFLQNKNIAFEWNEHEAVFDMAALSNVDLLYPERDAKNLFVRDDKKKQYYLITLKGDKRLDLKQFRQAHNARPLSFASEQDLWEKLHLTAGSVTPLGLLNNEMRDVCWYLDSDFLDNQAIIGVHPNDNTATVWLNVHDLIALIKENGHIVHIFELNYFQAA